MEIRHWPQEKPVEIEARIWTAQRDYRWLLVRNVPLRDALGGIVKWYGTGIDIEDRKRAEEALRKAQADLAHANRVTTMGELCASLAHEINQPISGAITNASTCLRRLDRQQPDLEGARAAASLIIRDANRAAEIINRVRLFFRKGVVTKERVDVNEMIREMEILLHNEATQHSVFVQTKLAADRPLIVADRIQLQQVLMNLMINGIDAMKSVDGPRQLTLGTKNDGNEQLLVSVEDTGIGLPLEPSGPNIQRFLYDQGTRHRYGAPYQPNDYRSPRRPALGHGEPSPRSKFSFHASCFLGRRELGCPEQLLTCLRNFVSGIAPFRFLSQRRSSARKLQAQKQVRSLGPRRWWNPSAIHFANSSMRDRGHGPSPLGGGGGINAPPLGIDLGRPSSFRQHAVKPGGLP